MRDGVQGSDTGRQLRVNRPFACIKNQGRRQSYVGRFLSSLWQPFAPAITRRIFGSSGSKAPFRLVVEESSYGVIGLSKQLSGVHACQIVRRSCTKAGDQWSVRVRTPDGLDEGVGAIGTSECEGFDCGWTATLFAILSPIRIMPGRASKRWIALTGIAERKSHWLTFPAKARQR